MTGIEEKQEKERQSYRKSERQKQIRSLLIDLAGFIVVGIFAFFRLKK